MKRTFFLLIITGLIVSTFSSCKYEEGPVISFLTKKARLNGEWSMVMVLNNDVNATKFYPKDYGYVFDKNGGFRKISNEVSNPGTWDFNADKTEIILSYEKSATTESYKILKLTNRHLWWKRTVNNDVIEEHFEAKK